MTLNQTAIALIRELVESFPQFRTDEPINGADSVDVIGVLVGKARELIEKIDKVDLRQLLHEPDEKIVVTRREIVRLCIEAEKALDVGDKYNALYEVREQLSEFLEDPKRRMKGKGKAF
jgi:hypothetical protein